MPADPDQATRPLGGPRSPLPAPPARAHARPDGGTGPAEGPHAPPRPRLQKTPRRRAPPPQGGGARPSRPLLHNCIGNGWLACEARAGRCPRAAALPGPGGPARCGSVLRAGAAARWRAREGRPVDALAPRGDEGRGTLRKAAGRCERSLIRGCPNGATPPHGEIPGRIHRPGRRTRGTETSQYPEEQTSPEIPRVVASERGAGQRPCAGQPKVLERSAAAGESPVGERPRTVHE